MLVISIHSTILSSEEAALLAHPKITGLVLFSKNYQNKQQLIALTNAIHAINKNLIIFVDQEGGMVQRFKHEFTLLPKAIEYGIAYAENSANIALNLAFNNGKIMASELLECGVDISLAPVLDSHNANSKAIGYYGRAFHQDSAQIIAELTASFARGMRAAGMQVCGKHFPDHGQCLVDSHIAMPVDIRSKTILMDYMHTVYGSLIEQDLLDYIMPAHVMYPNLDTDNPATYSKIILQNTLRHQLKFTGKIISDCLAMGAVANENSISLLARVDKALQAGQELVIICHQPVAVIENLLKLNNNTASINPNTSVLS